MMSHFPVDHPLRGLYRGLAFLTGVALAGYGVIGYVRTSSMEFFAQEGERVLGVTMNPAFAIFSVVSGAIVAVVTVIGRNVDAAVNMIMGTLFMLVGLAMLCLLRTDLNVLAFSVTNVNVMFVLGLVLLLAGLYGSVSRAHTHVADPGKRVREELAR